MIWVARYTRKNLKGEVIRDEIGNFTCGNSNEVIQKICMIQGIHPPMGEYDCRCEFETSVAEKPEEKERHTIVVGSLGQMIDIRS